LLIQDCKVKSATFVAVSGRVICPDQLAQPFVNVLMSKPQQKQTANGPQPAEPGRVFQQKNNQIRWKFFSSSLIFSFVPLDETEMK